MIKKCVTSRIWTIYLNKLQYKPQLQWFEALLTLSACYSAYIQLFVYVYVHFLITIFHPVQSSYKQYKSLKRSYFYPFCLCMGNINFSRDLSSVLDWYTVNIYFPCLSILGLRPHSLSSLSKKLWILFILLNSLSVNFISINWSHFRLLYVHTCLSLHQ